MVQGANVAMVTNAIFSDDLNLSATVVALTVLYVRSILKQAYVSVQTLLADTRLPIH